jgi:phosphohistidine phosphatase
MKRELLILRHGKSDWKVDVDDYQRPLKDRGKRDAQRVGVWLQQQGLAPDQVVSSPAERAIVTAEKVCKAMGLSAAMIVPDRRIYAAGPEALLAVLRGLPGRAQRVLLVGHNPGMEELLTWLVKDGVKIPSDGKLLATATLARLSLSGDWAGVSEGCARLLSLTRPGTLPKAFPFPDFQGDEWRERPAYYYTQSSVIPYRVRDGRLEVLLVSSSKQKHWVVPKGIQEPGLSPQVSAAKEAQEEAGVEGEVGLESLGEYRYEKWGGTCTVAVYPMAVERVIPESEWEERHRGREWVTPHEARERLKQRELVPLLEALEQKVLIG